VQSGAWQRTPSFLTPISLASTLRSLVRMAPDRRCSGSRPRRTQRIGSPRMNGSTNQGDRKRNPRNLSPKPPPPSGGELLTSQPEHTGNRGRQGFSCGGRLRRSAHSLRIRSCAFSRSRAENGHLPVLPCGRRVCTLEGQPLDQQQVQSERIKAGRGGGQARAGWRSASATSRPRCPHLLTVVPVCGVFLPMPHVAQAASARGRPGCASVDIAGARCRLA